MTDSPGRDLAAFFRDVHEYSAQVRAGLDPDAQAVHDEVEERWEANLFRGEAPTSKVPPFTVSGTTLNLDPTWKAGAQDDSEQIFTPEWQRAWDRVMKQRKPCGRPRAVGVRIAMKEPDGGDGDA
jgi:hypothetical protein